MEPHSLVDVGYMVSGEEHLGTGEERAGMPNLRSRCELRMLSACGGPRVHPLTIPTVRQEVKLVRDTVAMEPVLPGSKSWGS